MDTGVALGTGWDIGGHFLYFARLLVARGTYCQLDHTQPFIE